MKRKIWIFPALLFAISCSNNNTNTASTNADTVAKTAATTHTTASEPVTECFAHAGKDTLLLSITENNNAVNGRLYIHIDGKDVNQGNIDGMILNDTLIADYTFYSEGVQSVRQVVFIKQENTMVEGFGEVVEQDGKMVFKNTNALKFNDKNKLTKVNCAG